MAQGEELEGTVKELQDQLRSVQEVVNFFIKPLLISLCNDTVGENPGVPRVMVWISNQFYGEHDKARKQFLKHLHDEFREIIHMDPSRVPPLPLVVEEKVDLGIFER